MTDEERTETLARIRAAMVAVNSSKILREETRGLRAWQYALINNVSFARSAAKFGVTTGAIRGAVRRLAKVPSSSTKLAIIAERAQLAAQHAHDSAVPCTLRRAAILFAVPAEHVVDAWNALYPEQHKYLVG